MKKLLSIFIVLVLALGATLALVACELPNGDSSKPAKSMNVSLNPQVEFILDGNDKVLSVNALNEEGNLIITASAGEFEGKTAQEAATLFVSLSKEMGFVVKGSLGDNEINIEINGDAAAAEKLFNNVKAKVGEYLSAENITAQVAMVEATAQEHLEALRAQVAECAPYIEQAKLEAMNQMELMEELYKSRQETAELYSQELKAAYYAAKEQAFEHAKMETLKAQVPALFQSAFDVAYGLYNGAVETLEGVRKTMLIDETSIYQVALKSFREHKVAYLNYRAELAESGVALTEEQQSRLTELDGFVKTAEENLVKAGQDANTAIDNQKATLKANYDSVISTLESFQVKVSDHLDAISTAQQEAIAKVSADFETAYASAITAAENNWNAMKEQLAPTEDTTPQE